ncbi:MAG: hypothetical protein H6Q86_4489 [candidate division NC10 bacterium]|jgi:hypothetical protein|nr:hypothetical protein [candidate division NC10 bacterium]
MADLRYRTFRLTVYARLCPQDLRPGDRDRFLRLLDELDEDGMIAFFQQLPRDARAARVLDILTEARELGDRLNAMDRTLPVLPHTEITACYDRLRVLGGEIGDLVAADVLK